MNMDPILSKALLKYFREIDRIDLFNCAPGHENMPLDLRDQYIIGWRKCTERKTKTSLLKPKAHNTTILDSTALLSDVPLYRPNILF